MGENNGPARTSISQATSIEEIAEFWNTHDTADYWDQFEEVEVEFRLPRRHRVSIASEVYSRLADESRRQGVHPETLVNLWINERLTAATPVTVDAAGTSAPQAEAEAATAAEEKG